MKITPLPKDAIKDGVCTPLLYDWFKENEDALSELYEQSFNEWLENHIKNFAEAKDVPFGEKNAANIN